MTRNQDIALMIISNAVGNILVSYIGNSEIISVHYFDNDNHIIKSWHISNFDSDEEAVRMYDEILSFGKNEVLDNTDFQEEMQAEMESAAERDTKAVEEVF